mmetsp:Transcript_20456/g.43880  ORF Transcript_20456/g.43880 Transcript_20456/m.43880 type:complete len:121 (+) Transcript_20456:511-873(+)
MLYPIETEVSLAAGLNDSASQAIIGAPQKDNETPRNICAKRALSLCPEPIIAIAIGLAMPMANPPTAITRFLPTLSDNQPATGKRAHTLMLSDTLLTAKEFGTGGSIKSVMYTAIHTNVK